MTVLGLSVFCDASAAIVIDGEIVCAIEEERLNWMKHYEGFPWLSIDECLRIAGIRITDIDAIAIGWNPWMGWVTRIYSSIKDALRNPGILQTKLYRGGNYIDGIKRIVRLRSEFNRRYGIDTPPVHYVRHHLAHAASAFLASKFESAHIVVADGVGESDAVSFYDGEGSAITRKRVIQFPHSLGHLYASVTSFLGFQPACDEGKVMALASFGKDRYRELFDDVCPEASDGCTFRLRTDMLDYHRAREGEFSAEWMRRTSLSPRHRNQPFEEAHKDLACSLQACIERRMFALLRHTGFDDGKPLCAAGGLFLNSVLNGRLVRELTPEFFVQPAAGDNGVSLGAALYVSAQTNPSYKRRPMMHAFFGTAYTEETIPQYLAGNGQPYNQPRDTAEALSDDIIAGRIVASFGGRMEFGPRALGNRSILASPSLPDMKDTLNQRVKHRESFRPFAAAMLLEDIEEYFEAATESPYMLRVFYFKPEYRAMFPAICHIDGSCRLQTVTQEQNPKLHTILICMKRKTGHGIVLNTSLNVAGQPIVRTPDEALDLLRQTQVDVLYLGSHVIRKNEIAVNVDEREQVLNFPAWQNGTLESRAKHF